MTVSPRAARAAYVDSDLTTSRNKFNSVVQSVGVGDRVPSIVGWSNNPERLTTAPAPAFSP